MVELILSVEIEGISFKSWDVLREIGWEFCDSVSVLQRSILPV